MQTAHWMSPETASSHIRYMASVCLAHRATNHDLPIQDRQRNQVRFTIYAMVGAALALAVLIGVMSVFANPVPGKEPDYVRAALVCFGVIVAAGAITYVSCGNNNQARQQREGAMRMLCDRADHFNYAGRTEFDDYHVGTIPWFETEEWKHAFGMLGGRLPTTDFFILDCDQIVDPVLASSDSKLLQGAAHFVSNKHQRLYRSEMEAVVFSARLEHVPDLVIVPQRDPNRAYFKRTLRGQPCDLAEHYNLPRSLRNKYWIGSASPESCVAVLNDELQSLLSARDWCIVQVIGGYCVVMTAHWHGNRPAKAPKTETEIANNIEFAVQVFDHFWRQSPAATEAAEATNYNPSYHEPDHQDRRAGVATLSAPVRAAAPAASSSVARGSISQPTTAIPPLKAAARRRHSMLMLTALFGLGIPSSLLGSLCMIGTAVDLQRGEAAQAWPQVKGTITRAEIDTRVSGRNGRKREKYRPGIAYAYEVDERSYSNDKIMFGVTMRTESRQEIEQVMSAYPVGAGVDVCYDPNDPSSSVLQPGVENRSMILAIRNVSAGILVLGIALCGYGFMGRKRRP